MHLLSSYLKNFGFGFWKCNLKVIIKPKCKPESKTKDPEISFSFFISNVSAPLFIGEGFISLVPNQPQICSVSFNPFHNKDSLVRFSFSSAVEVALGKSWHVYVIATHRPHELRQDT